MQAYLYVWSESVVRSCTVANPNRRAPPGYMAHTISLPDIAAPLLLPAPSGGGRGGGGGGGDGGGGKACIHAPGPGLRQQPRWPARAALALLGALSGAAFTASPPPGRLLRAWAVAVIVFNIAGPIVFALVAPDAWDTKGPGAAQLDILAVDLAEMALLATQLWLIRATRATTLECVLRHDRGGPGAHACALSVSLLALVAYAVLSNLAAPTRPASALLSYGLPAANNCIAAGIGGLLMAELTTRVRAAAAAARAPAWAPGELPGRLEALFALRTSTARLAMVALARAIIFVSVGVAATFLPTRGVLTWILISEGWLLPAALVLAVLGSRVTRAFQELHLAVVAVPAGASGGSGIDRRDLAPYLAALEAQGALALRVFGVAVTYTNVARGLLTAATVSLSVITWGVRVMR